MGHETSGRPKPEHWGLRALAFLALAAASIITSNVLSLNGINGLNLITFIGLMVGLIGATVCSIRGIKRSGWLPKP